MKQNQIFQGYVLGQNGTLAIFHMKHKHKRKSFVMKNKLIQLEYHIKSNPKC